MNIAPDLAGKTGQQFRLPIVVHHRVKLPPEERIRIAHLARQIQTESPLLCHAPNFSENLSSGLIDAPALLVEDHSGIQLAHERGADAHHSYRALLLAGEGDLLAVYGKRYPAFEAYCRDWLGLGRVEVIAPPLADPVQSLADACLNDRHLIARAVKRAQHAGGLNVIPYMATGAIWRLAGEIAQQAGVPVRLAGPAPALMRAVNDKLWFARWAAKLLGEEAVPHSRAVYGMAALIGYLRRFMREHRRVAIKLSHSAASLGNLVLNNPEFSGMPAAEMSGRLVDMIDRAGWKNPFPLQVTAWEAPIKATLSAQLWIPYPEDGSPIVEGVFDQITANSNARFTGAVPSDLPKDVRDIVVEGAARLGLLFQTLGYFGRCSFDAVLLDNGAMAPCLHWVECNGRWGGVSIPMCLMNRLLGDWNSRSMLVTEQQIVGRPGLTMGQFLTVCEPELFTAAGEGAGAVLLSPGKLADGAFDLLILGHDRNEVLKRGRACASRLAKRGL